MMSSAIGDIVWIGAGDESLHVVIESAPDATLHLARLLSVIPSPGVRYVPIHSDEILISDASGIGERPTCVDTWGTCAVETTGTRYAGGALVAAAMDRLLRNMGRAVARSYYQAVHVPRPFEPGRSPVAVSGKCWGSEEMESLCEASLDFWLTTGRFGAAFESALAARIGRKHAFAVNSGSSANLLAMAALCSPLLKDRRLRPGDEVITVAAGFPTTVAPLVQLGGAKK